MLGRLEMTVDECMVAYIELSKDIFPEESIGQSSWWSKMFRLVSAYRAQALEGCLKKTIAMRLGDDEVN